MVIMIYHQRYKTHKEHNKKDGIRNKKPKKTVQIIRTLYLHLSNKMIILYCIFVLHKFLINQDKKRSFISRQTQDHWYREAENTSWCYVKLMV